MTWGMCWRASSDDRGRKPRLSARVAVARAPAPWQPAGAWARALHRRPWRSARAAGSQNAGRRSSVLAYPGIWLRPDIYATHGHYLDCHHQVATFECLARAVSERLYRKAAPGYRTPDDYEAVLAPLYQAIYRRRAVSPGAAAAGAAKAMVRARDGHSEPAYRGNSTAARPQRVRRGRVWLAMAQVVDGLGLDARYVIFGHLHRPGPLARRAEDWRTRAGPGSSTPAAGYTSPLYLGATAAESTDWPGTCSLVRAKVHRT